MKWLYLLLDLGTLLFPVLLSFDKKVFYFKRWKAVLLATSLISVPFILWDIHFTSQGVWGFNKAYISGIYIFNLPVEEVLFFVVVPFACIFIYECCKAYFQTRSFQILNAIVVLFIFVYATTIFLIDPLALYGVWVLTSALIVLFLWASNFHLNYIGISFLLSLIPFIIMNAALTGSFTDEPIVWYNDAQNSQIRLLSIPLEDVIYSFSLIVSTIITYEYINKRNEKNRTAL